MLALLCLPARAFEPYPATDPEVLVRSRLETEALWLAVHRGGRARARYARTAVAARKQRMARMSPAAVEAERAVEREGVGSGAALERTYTARDGRARAIAAGQAMATLLDDLAPGWRSADAPLDRLLDQATDGERTIPLDEDFPAALAETEELKNWIIAEETAYLIKPGYTLTLLAPMSSADADPFSALPLEDHTVLYPSDVALAGPAGTLSVEGHGAWVAMDEVRVSGLALEDLQMVHEGPDLVVTGPGLELRVRGALYKGTKTGMTIEPVPGTVMDPDPAAFALMALATAAGLEVVPRSAAPRRDAVALLRARVKEGGAACTEEIGRFQALAALDHPWLDGMLAQTVALGPPPTFAPDRDPEAFALPRDQDGRFAELPGLLAAYWRCAALESAWAAEREAYVTHGQDLLTRAAEPLVKAHGVESTRWPATVRIVPNLLDRPGRALPVSWGDEVTVFVGPPTGLIGQEPVDPAVVVQAALHHLVDPVIVGRGCPPLDAAWTAVSGTAGLAPRWTTTDTWVAESVARALALQAGALPKGRSADETAKAWVAEGFPLVPAVLAGLERTAAGVWLQSRCE